MKETNFLDKLKITINSGYGGDGCVSFNHSKFAPKGGPDGGNGGKGGDVFLISDKNINTLYNCKFLNKFSAENGFNGSKKNCSGKNGNNLNIFVPIGTNIINIDTKEIIGNLFYDKQKIIVAKGGKGGLGNFVFKSSTNQFPKFYTKGCICEVRNLFLELYLCVDVGIIGIPNSGKSSLICSISNSKSKISEYPFTTVVPNVSVVFLKKYENFSIVDTPGIIKNSTKGIGLGCDFLKHLYKCNLLLHIIDLSEKNKFLLIKNFKDVINELLLYNNNFSSKKQWILFNKIDLLNNYNNTLNYVNDILSLLNWKSNYYLISSKKKIGLEKLCLDIFKFIKDNTYKKNSYSQFELIKDISW